MGFYVNPPQESKEAFLEREGINAPFDLKLNWDSIPEGFLPVILVNNGSFTAAAIAYSHSELDEFTRMDDPRPRRIFLVKTALLIPVAGSDFVEYAKMKGLI